MYAWKCWRDSRILFRLLLTFQIGMLAIALLARGPHFTTTLPIAASQTREALVWMQSSRTTLYLFAIFCSMITADGFLLTRPIARWRMVWVPLGVALLELGAIWTITGCVVWLYVARVPSALVFSAGPSLPLRSVIPVIVVTYLICALAARSAMTLALLLMQRRRRLFLWLALAAGLAVYLGLSTIYTGPLQRMSSWLPVLLPPIVIPHGTSMIFHPDLAWQLASRVVLVLVFTLLAQKELERREI